MTEQWDGRPENPERGGAHWLRRKSGGLEAWTWDPDADGCGTEYSGAWQEGDGDGQPEDMARWFNYEGPCLTPAEVAAAVQAEREACAAIFDRLAITSPRWAPPAENAAAIRARGPADALDAALAQARREGMEAAARIVDAVYAETGGIGAYAMQIRMQAARIRAAAGEAGE